MPHPLSQLRAPDGRQVDLKAHGCAWSGQFPENSLAAIRECLSAQVARAEIDIQLLRDADFLVTHDSSLDAATSPRTLSPGPGAGWRSWQSWWSP